MNFREFLQESKDQLDISIQAAGKYLTSQKRIEEFLSSDVQIEHKTDGVKLTIMKVQNKGTHNDYIFAFKNNILYSTEYDYQPNTKVKKESIGASQFKKVFQHFAKIKKNAIPVGTELFVEFLMSKPTLSSNYSTKHKMVLIGYSKSTYTEKFGKLKTQNSGMQTDLRDKYAKELKIDAPQLLFEGVLGSETQFSKGIRNATLKSEFDARKNSLTWDNPELLLDDIRTLFLDIDSKYGGKEEGVVLKYQGHILKWQQEYQLDQAARAVIKMKYKDDNPENETVYWNNVKALALELSNSITVKSRQLKDVLEELSLAVQKYKLNFHHSKKTDANIKDDVQLSTKTLIIKKMKGNNNALIIGKFRVLTKEGHQKLIKRASNLYDEVVVCIVTSKDTKDTKELRTKMIQTTFPNVFIIHATTGNLSGILQKSPVNINVVYAGSDRVQNYRDQLKNTQGVDVKEMPRTSSDISASKVLGNINDRDYFEKNTPKEIHKFYSQLKV